MIEEQILEYIEGRLEADEKAAFEKRLEVESELKASFQRELGRHTALKAIQRAEQKETLKKVLGQPKAKVSVFQPRWRLASIAAGIILLFLLGYLLIPGQQRPEQFAMQYFEPYPLSNVRGESDDQQALFDQALVPYQNGDFQTALPYLRQLLEADPNNAQLKLNLASALMVADQNQEAISLLQTIKNQSADAAEWYLALGYLRDGQLAKAKELLQAISGKSHFKQTEAGDLLEEL
jgi:predicted Zn-dependent protease